jgi:NAD-reducing hydrogenase large subunit
MIIATEHNNTAYNKAVTQVAKKYINGKRLSEGLLNRVEAVVRAFDPCLSCASHAFGTTGLDVRICGPDGNLLDETIK